MKRLIIISCCLTMLMACNQKNVKPQTPANAPEIDTVAQNLLYTNQMLVQQANLELSQYVKNSGLEYALHDKGFWYRRLVRTDEEQLQPEMTADIHYTVSLIDSTLCMDISCQIRVGKKEVPPAIDHSLQFMHRGEKYEILAPWYCAYGQKGENNVPAYTNVRIILEVQQ